MGGEKSHYGCFANKSTILCIFDQQAALKKIDTYRKTHRYAIAYPYIVLPARGDAFEDTHVYVCTCEEEPWLGGPQVQCWSQSRS